MKTVTTLIILAISIQSYAIDRFVNPNLSSGNGTTLFTTITSAVNAAVNGDRIIVAANAYNEATLTIGKSLKIIPQTAGSTIIFNANIIIAGFPGMKLEIIGFNLGIYSVSSNAISGGSVTNRAKVSIIECSIANVGFDNDYYDLNLINSSINGMVTFKFGNIIRNSIQTVLLFDEMLDSQSTTEKILISNNTISSILGIFNNNYRFVVSNNNLKYLSVKRWNSENSVKNKIVNNNFSNGAVFQISWGNVPSYNIVFSSNKFSGTCSFYNYSTDYGVNLGNFNFYDTTIDYRQNFFCGAFWPSYTIDNQTSSSSIYFPNPNAPGTFEWSYNGIGFTCPTPNSSQPLSLIRIIGPTGDIDGGNPNHDYYDIDLTINDRGVNGGPYSQLNYNPTLNPNNSKAFIFDLEMPTDLFPGQNVNITAKGYHKN